MLLNFICWFIYLFIFYLFICLFIYLNQYTIQIEYFPILTNKTTPEHITNGRK